MRAPTFSLPELQRWFVAMTTSPGAMRDPSREAELERLVTPGPSLAASERLEIYHHGYFARLVECLADDYPALAAALGESTFSALARDYIERYPSRSPSLNAYGEHFAEFCRTRTEPWARFAADLARLEWALVEVVHEPAGAPLTLEALATVPESSLRAARLLPSPGLRVLLLDYPVDAFYQASREGLGPTIPAPARTAVVVYREGLSLVRLTIDPAAASLLLDLSSGLSLELSVPALERRWQESDRQSDLAALLPLWLATWVKVGFFSGIELP